MRRNPRADAWDADRALSKAQVAIERAGEALAAPPGQRTFGDLLAAWGPVYTTYYIWVALQDQAGAQAAFAAMKRLAGALAQECGITPADVPPPPMLNPTTVTVDAKLARRMLGDAAAAIERLKRSPAPIGQKLSSLLLAVGIAHVAATAESDRGSPKGIVEEMAIHRAAVELLKSECRRPRV